MTRLAAKVVVVTGGDSGIGAGIVRAVAAEGADVVVNFRSDADAAEAVAGEASTLGVGRAVAVRADVSRVADLTDLLAKTIQEFGRLDVWVNNAGVGAGKTLLETTEDDYDTAVAVDQRGVFFATQLAARQFIDQGDGGLIVNVTSVHEEWPMPGNIAYCVAKGGVRMLTRTAGVELAAHGIRVVNVAPGAVDTPMNSATTGDPVILGRLIERIPARRLARPDDIAAVVAFLAGDTAGYVNATTVVVDGGMSQRGSDL